MKKEGVEPTSSVEKAKEQRTYEMFLDTVDMDQVHRGETSSIVYEDEWWYQVYQMTTQRHLTEQKRTTT